jgi:hypothetical protein
MHRLQTAAVTCSVAAVHVQGDRLWAAAEAQFGCFAWLRQCLQHISGQLNLQCNPVMSFAITASMLPLEDLPCC